MKTSVYKDLGIVSAKKPADAYRIVEKEDGVIYMVDSADTDVLIKSIDKGDNWTTVFEENGWEIECIFYDYVSKLLWIGINDGVGHPTIHYFDTEDSDAKTDMDQYSTGDAGTYTVMNIFRTNSKIYAITYEDRAGTETFSISKIDVNPMVNTDSEAQVGAGALVRWTTFLPTGTADEGWFFAQTDAPEDFAYYFLEGIGAFLDVGGFPAGYTLHTDYTKTGITKGDAAYGTAHIILTKTATGAEYLYSFDTIGFDFTELSLFDVLLQSEILSDPNELEKAFSTNAVETIYEIKSRGTGLVQLQNISGISDAVIIAITDNFVMNNDGDMFELQDVVSEMSNISYNDGIIKIPKKGIFTCHPDFHINWSEGDTIKWYDDNDVLEFWGEITNKNRNNRGLYVIKVDSLTNEIYRQTYQKSYSGDDLDTKQKDIIDNGCDFCYRSSSIVGTTQTFDYVYNRVIVYMFWFGRRFERQVPYIESDGKIWTKAHDGLVATGKSWDLNDKNQEVFLIDIPRLEEHTQGFFEGNTGITRNTIRYKNNATVIRPVAATRDPIEQLKGILPLNEFRDPKLEAATEANQLGDNRYAIWSKSTIFLGLRIEGQGYLQPGKTIEIQNTGQTTITKDDFLILSFIRDPLRDLYTQMILSDNIIFPSEFNNKDNTSRTQVHTASVQALENQSAIAAIAGISGALITVSVETNNGTGSDETLGRKILNAVSEYIQGGIYLDGNVMDSTEDIVLTFALMCTSADANVVIKRFLSANKTDNSEPFAWNIDSAVADGFDSTNANNLTKHVFTFLAADIEDSDNLEFAFMLNEGGRTVNIYSVSATYTHV